MTKPNSKAQAKAVQRLMMLVREEMRTVLPRWREERSRIDQVRRVHHAAIRIASRFGIEPGTVTGQSIYDVLLALVYKHWVEQAAAERKEKKRKRKGRPA